jgi:hypothetical protein
LAHAVTVLVDAKACLLLGSIDVRRPRAHEKADEEMPRSAVFGICVWWEFDEKRATTKILLGV